MRISSAGQSAVYNFGQVGVADNDTPESSPEELKKNQKTLLASSVREEIDDTVKNGKNISQDHLDFMVEKAINASSRYLHDGLVDIFTGGEKLLAGKSEHEYEQHIDELSEAIKGQDYKRAEKLIDRFFGGSTDKIVSRVKSLASEAENKFWKGIDDSLKYLEANKNEYDLEFNGRLYKNISIKDIARLAVDQAKGEVDKFSEQDFSGLIGSIRKEAVANAKDNLKNAGRNRYSEDAASVTASAADFSRNLVFNTDDINIKEDDTELADIYALKEGENINQEQIDRIKHRNTRKTDTFSGYMRERSDRFKEVFGELSHKAVLVKEAEQETEAGTEQIEPENTISTNLLAGSQQAQSLVSIKDFEELQNIVPEQKSADKSNSDPYAEKQPTESYSNFKTVA
ncbi:hypothetical protein [Maridesulfovibrio sp. FT414]|uniref:hypothetical protein n=1 Tax=Maridesulfovibrio sp. FT414 TaxID=2979469 RepID=UPI003D802F7F